MKRFLIIAAVSVLALVFPARDLAAQTGFTWYDASALTLTGKLFSGTTNPYHRVEASDFEGFDATELQQIKQSTGLAVAFKTDSENILVSAKYVKISPNNSTALHGTQGFDLYTREKGEWRWAGGSSAGEKEYYWILAHQTSGMREYILYLPIFSELSSLKIGVGDGSRLEAIPNPFRHRVAVFGSSFTQGYGCTRPAMPYPAQLSRMTGVQFINLGCSGHSLLQHYFAEVLAEADVDAYLFDAFSNPTSQIIDERLFDFIETIQSVNPGKPLIFQKTLYREWRSFNSDVAAKEEAKQAMVEKKMKEACKLYKDVYYVDMTDASLPSHDTTLDGTHPSDYGYTLWAESVKDQVMKILFRYGIR